MFKRKQIEVDYDGIMRLLDKKINLINEHRKYHKTCPITLKPCKGTECEFYHTNGLSRERFIKCKVRGIFRKIGEYVLVCDNCKHPLITGVDSSERYYILSEHRLFEANLYKNAKFVHNEQKDSGELDA